MSTLNEEIIRLEQAKIKIDEILIARGISIPTGATLDTYYELINSIQGGTSSSEVTATRANVLSGTTTITSDSNDEIVEGTMVNHGAVSQSLNAGGSYIIPAGYHNGSGKVTANNLTSQTSGTATASEILNGKTAWVNGSQISGGMANNSTTSSNGSVPGINSTHPEIPTREGAGLQLCTDTQGTSRIHLCPPAGYYPGSGTSYINRPASEFGTATTAQVLSGKTFTSTSGIKISGTLAVTSAISFKAAATSGTSIRISWTNPSKGPWEGVFIQMSTSGNPGVSGGSRIYTGKGATTNAGASNYVDITGLSYNTTYYFTCTSYASGLGNGASYNVSAKTNRYSTSIDPQTWNSHIAQFDSYSLTNPEPGKLILTVTGKGLNGSSDVRCVGLLVYGNIAGKSISFSSSLTKYGAKTGGGYQEINNSSTWTILYDKSLSGYINNTVNRTIDSRTTLLCFVTWFRGDSGQATNTIEITNLKIGGELFSIV